MNFFFYIKGGKLNDQIIAKGCAIETIFFYSVLYIVSHTRSFQVLAELNPGTLMDLPHFKLLIQALDSRLPEGEGGIAQCRGT